MMNIFLEFVHPPKNCDNLNIVSNSISRFFDFFQNMTDQFSRTKIQYQQGNLRFSTSHFQKKTSVKPSNFPVFFDVGRAWFQKKRCSPPQKKNSGVASTRRFIGNPLVVPSIPTWRAIAGKSTIFSFRDTSTHSMLVFFLLSCYCSFQGL